MKKATALIKLITILVAISILLIACSDDFDGYHVGEDGFFIPDSPVALAIILGRHANAMAIPNDAYILIDSFLDRAVYGGYVCVIVSDGYPTKSEDFVGSDFFKTDRRSQEALTKEIKKRTGFVSKQLRNENLIADDSENDLLAALREAKNALSASHVKNIPDKQIIIIDTGVLTEGDLSFAGNDYLTLGKPDIEKTVDNLKTGKRLPDLTGVAVTFIGTESSLAKVAAPQILSVDDEIFIKDLWKEISEKSGAKSVNFENVSGWKTPNIHTEDISSQFLPVKSVFISKEGADVSLWGGDDSYDITLPAPPDLKIKLPSTTVGFKPDSAEFSDDHQATQILEPYAKALKEHIDNYPDNKIWLVGTTAAIQKNGSGDTDLGLRRAEKVQSVLISTYGIPSNKLITLGVGARFPWHVDEFSKGAFDTVVAQENRAVWFLSNVESNEQFTALMNDYKDGKLLPDVTEKIDNLMK